jgi:hypothetical protein
LYTSAEQQNIETGCCDSGLSIEQEDIAIFWINELDLRQTKEGTICHLAGL